MLLLCRFSQIFSAFLGLFLAAFPSGLFASPLFYSMPYQSTDGLSDIRAIEYVESSGLWLLDQQGKVLFFDGTHFKNLDDFIPMDGGRITDIEVYEHQLWYVSDGVLYRYFHQSNEIKPVSLPSAVTDISSDSSVLWIATNTALYQYHIGLPEPEKYVAVGFDKLLDDQSVTLGVSNGALFGLHEVKKRTPILKGINAASEFDGELWIGTEHGLSRYLKDGGVERYLTFASIHDVARNDEGLWVGTNKGLYFAKKTEEDTPNFERVFLGDINNTLSQSIKDIVVSKENEVWVATDAGISYRASHFRGILRASLSEKSLSLSDKDISSIVQWGSHLIVSVRNRLIRLDESLNVIANQVVDVQIEKMTLHSGLLWVSSALGIKVYDPETFKPILMTLPPALKAIPIDKMIGDGDSLWISSGARLYRFWANTLVRVDFGNDWSGREKASLLSLIPSTDKGTWLGTTNGLYRYFDGQFTRELSSAYIGAVKSLSEDKNGVLWLLTTRGIYTLNPTAESGLDTRFTNRYGEETSCLFLRNEVAYIFSNKGVYRQTLSDKHSAYSPLAFNADPILGGSFACSASDYQITVASRNGILKAPFDVLSQLVGKTLNAPSLGAIYLEGKPWRLTPGPDSIYALPTTSSLTVKIGQLPLKQFEELVYRLDGNSGEGEWHATRDNRIVLDRLEAGQYQLRVKLREGLAQSSEFELLRLSIGSPWYQRIAVFSVLATLLFFVLYYQKKYATMRLHNRRLRTTVHKKVDEIERRTNVAGGKSDIKDEARNQAETAEDSANTQTGRFATNECEIEKQEWKNAVLRSIEKNFYDPDYSPSSLANALYLSERSLQRRIRVEFDKTFKELLISKRLDKAKRMLAQGDRITDVSVACGFNEPSYFAKLFKAKFGITPSKYREVEIGEKKKSVV